MEQTREMQEHRMAAEMKNWDARLDTLKARANKAPTRTESDDSNHIAELRVLHEAAKRHFEQLQSTSRETWRRTTQDSAARWESVSASIDSVWARVER